jgi:hypothetical protein
MHQFLYFSATKLVFTHTTLRLEKKIKIECKKKITSRFLDIIIKFGTIN